MRVVEMHEMFEHLRKCAALTRLEGLEDESLRRHHCGCDVADETPTRRGDVERLGAPIPRAVHPRDQFFALQPADHTADRGAVEGYDIAQRGLVDTGTALDGH